MNMEANKRLYQYMFNQTWELTEEWYNSLDKSDPTGIYSTNDPKVIQYLKEENHEFHKRFCLLFLENDRDALENFQDWITGIAKDDNHLKTPIHYIFREFFRTQEQYLIHFQRFVTEFGEEFSEEIINDWRNLIIHAFSLVMTKFSEEHDKYSQMRLIAQQEMIKELSSPVISLNKSTAVLPLVGDIDTDRARYIMENTLSQCAKKNIEHLFIDLSGVVMIDTMVAQQIFQIIESLGLLGVQTTLSGIRPEIAQTAIQLGISFEKVSITSTLEKAIENAN
ncbi:STAS domain-containing protein [Bacillus weihaiensis]